MVIIVIVNNTSWMLLTLHACGWWVYGSPLGDVIAFPVRGSGREGMSWPSLIVQRLGVGVNTEANGCYSLSLSHTHTHTHTRDEQTLHWVVDTCIQSTTQRREGYRSR